MVKYHPGQVVYETNLEDEAWKARMTLLCDLLTDMVNRSHTATIYVSAKKARDKQLKKRKHNGITHHG